MATDYDKLTREELIEAFDEMGRNYCRLTTKAEVDRQQIAALQGQVKILTHELATASREIRDNADIKSIALKVSTSLASAWTDMIDHLIE